MTRPLALVVLILFGAPAAQADVAPDPLHEGLSPKTRKPTAVVMAAETVDIRLGDAARCDFALEFEFRNPTAEAETLEVGFPTSYKDELKGLVVEVDGSPVEVGYAHETEIYRMGPTGDEYTKTSHTHWLTWTMTFPAGATRKVSMRYWVVPRDNAHWGTRYRDLRERIENDFPDRDRVPPPVMAVHRSMDTVNTGYTLVTGAGWAGRIGKAVITVAHPTHGSGVLRSFHPMKDYTLTPAALVWTFEDFEPTFDLDIEYTTGRTLAAEIALVEGALKAVTDRQGLLILLDHLLTMTGDAAKRIPVLQEIVAGAETRKYKHFYGNPLYQAYPTLLGLLDARDPAAAAVLRARAEKHLEGLKKGLEGWDLEKVQETLDRVRTAPGS
jgi:hypothetical protein